MKWKGAAHEHQLKTGSTGWRGFHERKKTEGNERKNEIKQPVDGSERRFMLERDSRNAIGRRLKT